MSQAEHRPSTCTESTRSAISEKLPTYSESGENRSSNGVEERVAGATTANASRTSKVLDGPPSYNTLFPSPNLLGRNFRRRFSRTASQDNQPRVVLTCCRVTCNTTILLVIVSIIFLLPVAMIIVGAQHINDCPIEKYIPIFLVVMGIIQMLECCGRVIYHMSREEEDNDEGTKDICVFFLVAWFIAGNVWVFRNYSSYTPIKNCTSSVIKTSTSCAAGTNADYCDDTTMKFAFWVIIALYILLAFVLVALCIYCCLKALASNSINSSE
ncbi:transmembrane protein 272-like [Corticium candelabrum]|uniref:transmembrane protein 272-like n=1 Tax=Corticium candelabrum TaxID=121492 RepID=UPI002E25D69A|nr:transmembrane protein 272-like [Corticium candelabrum]